MHPRQIIGIDAFAFSAWFALQVSFSLQQRKEKLGQMVGSRRRTRQNSTLSARSVESPSSWTLERAMTSVFPNAHEHKAKDKSTRGLFNSGTRIGSEQDSCCSIPFLVPQTDGGLFALHVSCRDLIIERFWLTSTIFAENTSARGCSRGDTAVASSS